MSPYADLTLGYPILDEAAAALDRAGQVLSAHLAGAERVNGEQEVAVAAESSEGRL